MLTAGAAVAARPEADLSKTSMIRLGTEQTEVLKIMGMYPQKTEISDGVTEWHYCATGYGMDEFVAVYFAEEKVVAMKNTKLRSMTAKASMVIAQNS